MQPGNQKPLDEPEIGVIIFLGVKMNE